MTRIACGWCGAPTEVERCASCGRDPVLAWQQRGQEPRPIVPDASGRPTLDASEIRRLYTDARDALEADGRTATVEAIAEQLDRSPRTVRDWRKRFGLE